MVSKWAARMTTALLGTTLFGIVFDMIQLSRRARFGVQLLAVTDDWKSIIQNTADFFYDHYLVVQTF